MKVWQAWAVFALGLLATALVSVKVQREVELSEVRQFAYASDQITQKIHDRLATQELMLRGGAGLFAQSEQVSRKQWHAYWATLDAEKTLPGVQGFGFAQLIPAGQLAAHIEHVHREGFAQYSINPVGKRQVYSSVVFIEPFSDRNLRAFGYDMFAEPVRHIAMEHARDDGHATLSGRVKLVQETGTQVQAGVLMYVPVYRQGMPTQTLAQRQAALIGWSYSPNRMSDLMQGILQDWQTQLGKQIDLLIYDSLQATPAAQLFSTRADTTPQAPTAFYQQRTVDFNDQRWLLVFDHAPSPSHLASASLLGTVAGGTLISALLCWLMLSVINTGRNAARIAERLTEQIRQREQALSESEQRWSFALDGSGLGVWDWDIATSTVFYSKRWKTMLGYAEDEIGNHLAEWEKHLHPEDRNKTKAKVKACLEGKTPYYESEHRLLCKDGHYLWIRDRGMVIQRDEQGQALRMIGTHSDISEHMQSMLRTQQLARLYAALSECNAAIVRCSTEQELFARACKVIVEFGGMNMTWIGLMDADSGMITVTSAFGQGTQYLDAIQISIHADDPHGRGATGTAIRENQPVWIENFNTDPRAAPWRDKAQAYGWQSSAALPICRAGRPIGALTFYSDELDWYDQEMRALFEGMATQISYALDKLDSQSAAKAYQASVLEAQQHLQRLFEATPVPMQVHASADLHISAINQAHQAWLGYPLDDIASAEHWFSQTHPEPEQHQQGHELLQQCVAAADQGVILHTPEFSLRCKDGTRRIAKGTMARVGNDIIVAWTDLSEIRHSEQELRESEQRFRNMVEQTISGMFVRRAQTLVYVNPSFCAMTGYSAQELTGQDVLMFIPDEPQVREHLQSVWAQLEEHPDAGITYSGPIRRKDGAIIELSLTAKMITWDDGLPATIVMAQDITERKRAEEQIAAYVKKLENTMRGTLQAVSNMVEMRDPYTAGHERRVGLIASAIAREMGWSAERCESLELLGLVHDIGKIAVPSEILTKPTRLSRLEMEMMKGHAEAGYEILKDVTFLAPVAEVIRQHHERMDGSGYPRGLSGDEILPEARVLAVADVLESMSAHRPYRAALGLEAALAEVEQGKYQLYDGEVVEAALRLFREQRQPLP